MFKSQVVKEFVVKQKVQVKVEKECCKYFDNFKDWGIGKQFVEMFKLICQVDFQFFWWVIGFFVVGVVVFIVFGFIFIDLWWVWFIVGIFVGVVVVMWVFQWCVKCFMYVWFKGQIGLVEVVLFLFDKKKWIFIFVIVFIWQQDVVYCVVGLGGIVFIGEGYGNGLCNLLVIEIKCYEQVVYGILVMLIIMGDGKGQVLLEDFDKYIKKLFKIFSMSQVDEVVNCFKVFDVMCFKVLFFKGLMLSFMKGVCVVM